jgi:mRNA interferase HigB
VNVISKRGLATLIEAANLDKDTRKELDECCRTARAASWRTLIDVQAVFPSADQVGHALIFNIRHNRYRLITRVDFGKQKLYLKAVLTHKEYDRKEWKKWA